jgi:hypothetical protein
MVSSSIKLEFTSPYKNTNIYERDGRTFFGLWNPLPVRMDGDEEEVVVRDGQEGQLDLFAYAAYGDRRLWMVIAHANKIDLPLLEVVPGMRLTIPKKVNVDAALTSAFARLRF